MLTKASRKFRYLLGGMWFLVGTGKLLAVMMEILLQRPLISSVMEFLNHEVTWSFYKQICQNYYLPYALFFIFAAAIIETISSVLILKGKNLAKLGFLGVSFVFLVYLPFHQGVQLMGMLILLLLQLILIFQKNEEDLVLGIIKKIRK